MAEELATRERTQQHIEHLRATEGRLSRKMASMEREVAVLTDRVEHVRVQVAEGVAMLAIEGRLRQVTDIISALQSNAYGERGSVFSMSNLLLAGNQLFWTFLDPVLKQVRHADEIGERYPLVADADRQLPHRAVAARQPATGAIHQRRCHDRRQRRTRT